MLIDIHTHVFPDNLAPRAIAALTAHSGTIPSYDGTAQGLQDNMRSEGVDTSVTFGIAVKPDQDIHVNDFAISLIGRTGLCPFGSVHPYSSCAHAELDRLAAAGIQGVKLHPEYQHFDSLGSQAYAIYEHIVALGMRVIFHCGIDPAFPGSLLMPPSAVARIATDFPRLCIIAGHMGGLMMADDIRQYILGREIYLDTSMADRFMSPQEFSSMASKHSSELLLFGSDNPWSRVSADKAFLESARLTDEQLEKIYYINSQRLLHL